MDLFEPWRNAPPARHTLESDSEEEQDPEDVNRAGPSTSTRFLKPAPVVEVQWTSEQPPAEDVDLIIANDEAGMAWSEGLDLSSLPCDGFLLVDGVKAASLTCFKQPKSTIIAFVAASATYEAMHAIAGRLLHEIHPSNTTVFDSYSFSSYLSSSPLKPTIRYLSTGTSPQTDLEPCEPPNLVQGLTAAFACEADERDIPCLILLFPSNLSDSTSASVIVHATHRQPVPDSVYDYGGPLPGSESLLDNAQNRKDLASLSEELGWNSFGWRVPQSSSIEHKRSKGRNITNEAGFGWWQNAKRTQRQVISDGGMYI